MFIPSQREMARSGRNARSVRMDRSAARWDPVRAKSAGRKERGDGIAIPCHEQQGLIRLPHVRYVKAFDCLMLSRSSMAPLRSAPLA